MPTDQFVPRASGNIASVEYDSDRQEMAVEFQDLDRYVYLSVPQGTYEQFKAVALKGESAGKFFYRNIRNVYAFILE